MFVCAKVIPRAAGATVLLRVWRGLITATLTARRHSAVTCDVQGAPSGPTCGRPVRPAMRWQINHGNGIDLTVKHVRSIPLCCPSFSQLDRLNPEPVRVRLPPKSAIQFVLARRACYTLPNYTVVLEAVGSTSGESSK